MRPFLLSAAILLLSGSLFGLEPDGSFYEPNAVLVNISEADLNRIVQDLFRERVGPRIEGVRSDPSRGYYDLSYQAGFSEPVLQLGSEGRMRIDLDLLDARVRVGRMERKFLRRKASCDGAGLTLDSDQPVGFAVSVRFEVLDHDIHVIPEDVTLENTKGFRLEKPTSCRNTLLPKWLVWWIGKGKLRRKIERLDDLILDRARAGAAELNAEGGFLSRHWSFQPRDDSVEGSDLYLYPQNIDTSHGSLLVGFAGASTEPHETSYILPEWVATESGRSYLGLSESFLNAVIGASVERLRTTPRKPRGNMSKLLRGSAALSLIPGLREVESPESIRVGLAFLNPPKIEFDTIDAAPDRALIRVDLSGAEMTIWEGDSLLGTLEIESSRLAVAPYLSAAGGISFDVIENEWRLSSRGIEFDEETLAAVFQELFFGEMFETRYDPVGRESFELGETKFNPRYFSLLGQHLVIGLTDF